MQIKSSNCKIIIVKAELAEVIIQNNYALQLRLESLCNGINIDIPYSHVV